MLCWLPLTLTLWQRQALTALGLLEEGADKTALAAAIERLTDTPSVTCEDFGFTCYGFP
ncbi:MAG: hypothetical protein JO212_20275 [Acetobacteraceae bacterium]|nr:hypothetical protein [Acetobacteraceae bacterium]